MKYDVGEVLYLLSKKNNKMVPARVDSVITVKKIGGEKTTHELSFPGIDRTTVLEKLEVIPFSNLLELRKYMLNFLEQKIDSEIASAKAKAENAWPNEESPNSTSTAQEKVRDYDDFQIGNAEETMQVELPGGGMATVHLPKELV